MKHDGKKIRKKIEEIMQLRHTVNKNCEIIMGLMSRIKELEDDKAELHNLLAEYRRKGVKLKSDIVQDD